MRYYILFLVLALLTAGSLSSVGQVKFTCIKVEATSMGRDVPCNQSSTTVVFKDSELIIDDGTGPATIRLVASSERTDTFPDKSVHCSWTGISETGTEMAVRFVYKPGHETLALGGGEGSNTVLTYYLKKVETPAASTVGSQMRFTCYKAETLIGSSIQPCNRPTSVILDKADLLLKIRGKTSSIRLINTSTRMDTLADGSTYLHWDGINETGNNVTVAYIHSPDHDGIVISSGTITFSYYLKRID